MPSSACKKSARSEEHTSELQSHSHLVCRLLLEKKNKAVEESLQHIGLRLTVGGRPVEVTRAVCGASRTLPCVRVLHRSSSFSSLLFFFNDTATTEIFTLPLHDPLPINDPATTEIYTLSLHDALPISVVAVSLNQNMGGLAPGGRDSTRRWDGDLVP